MTLARRPVSRHTKLVAATAIALLAASAGHAAANRDKQRITLHVEKSVKHDRAICPMEAAAGSKTPG